MNEIMLSENPLNSFRNMYKQEMLINLNNKINTCSKCDNSFCHIRYNGSHNAKVLIINDNACSDKDIQEYYNDLLKLSELDINDIYHAYAVSCVTTRQDGQNTIQRIPSKKECNNCKSYLNEVIDIIQPKIIVSLGATALNQFIPGSNLLDYIESKQIFNGVPTLINYSVKDLFNLCKYKSDEEIDTISCSILNTLNEAARYISMKGE